MIKQLKRHGASHFRNSCYTNVFHDKSITNLLRGFFLAIGSIWNLPIRKLPEFFLFCARQEGRYSKTLLSLINLIYARPLKVDAERLEK